MNRYENDNIKILSRVIWEREFILNSAIVRCHYNSNMILCYSDNNLEIVKKKKNALEFREHFLVLKSTHC